MMGLDDDEYALMAFDIGVDHLPWGDPRRRVPDELNDSWADAAVRLARRGLIRIEIMDEGVASYTTEMGRTVFRIEQSIRNGGVK